MYLKKTNTLNMLIFIFIISILLFGCSKEVDNTVVYSLTEDNIVNEEIKNRTTELSINELTNELESKNIILTQNIIEDKQYNKNLINLIDIGYKILILSKLDEQEMYGLLSIPEEARSLKGKPYIENDDDLEQFAILLFKDENLYFLRKQLIHRKILEKDKTIKFEYYLNAYITGFKRQQEIDKK